MGNKQSGKSEKPSCPTRDGSQETTSPWTSDTPVTPLSSHTQKCGEETSDRDVVCKTNRYAQAKYRCNFCPSVLVETHGQYAKHMTQVHRIHCCESGICKSSATVLKPAPAANKSILADNNSEAIFSCFLHPKEQFVDKASLEQHLKVAHKTSCLFCGFELGSTDLDVRKSHSDARHGAHRQTTITQCAICKRELKICVLREHLMEKHNQVFCCAQRLCGVPIQAKSITETQIKTVQNTASQVVQKTVTPNPEKSKTKWAASAATNDQVIKGGAQRVPPAEIVIRCMFHPHQQMFSQKSWHAHRSMSHASDCLRCGMKLKEKGERVSHGLKFHPGHFTPSPINCTVCGFRLPATQLGYHLELVHGHPFCCAKGVCGIKQPDPKMEAQEPQSSINAEVTLRPEEDLPLRCFFHPTEKFSKRTLTNHLYQRHNTACLCCGMNLGATSKRWSHGIAYHPGHFSTEITKCTICDAKVQRAALCNHIKNEHGHPFCCAEGVCGIPVIKPSTETSATKAENETKVSRNTLSASGPSSSTSDIRTIREVRCGVHPELKFASISVLLQHLRENHSLSCSFCGLDFDTAEKRMDHSCYTRSNDIVTPLVCTLCRKQPKSHASLNQHLKDGHGQAFCCAQRLCGVVATPKSDSNQPQETQAKAVDVKPSSSAQSLPVGILQLIYEVLSKEPDKRMTDVQMGKALKEQYNVVWSTERDLLNIIFNGRSVLTIETSEDRKDTIWIKIK